MEASGGQWLIIMLFLDLWDHIRRDLDLTKAAAGMVVEAEEAIKEVISSKVRQVDIQMLEVTQISRNTIPIFSSSNNKVVTHKEDIREVEVDSPEDLKDLKRMADIYLLHLPLHLTKHQHQHLTSSHQGRVIHQRLKYTHSSNLAQQCRLMLLLVKTISSNSNNLGVATTVINNILLRTCSSIHKVKGEDNNGEVNSKVIKVNRTYQQHILSSKRSILSSLYLDMALNRIFQFHQCK